MCRKNGVIASVITVMLASTMTRASMQVPNMGAAVNDLSGYEKETAPVEVYTQSSRTISTTAANNEPEVEPVFPVPLDAGLQEHIVQLCDTYKIEPELVLAVIEHESGYNPAATGDDGNSHGLLQIQPRWHRDRMERLGCSDLFDPYQNVTVGIDLLAELIEKYDTLEMALMVYNAGPTGAHTCWFSKEIYSNDYSRTVLSIAEGLKGAEAWQEY